MIGHVAHSLGFENVVVLGITLMMFGGARTIPFLASPFLKSLLLIPQLISGLNFSIINAKRQNKDNGCKLDEMYFNLL